MRSSALMVGICASLACSVNGNRDETFETAAGSEDSGQNDDGSEVGSDDEGSSSEGGTKFDVGTEGTTGGVELCKVMDDTDPVACSTTPSPPDSFDPEIQWSWKGPDGERSSIITPLVANFTDDNGDGEIDLCDTPDVLVLASKSSSAYALGHAHLLNGQTGELELTLPPQVSASHTPAIGDIDGDGLVEIVIASAFSYPNRPHLVAFNHDGTILWDDGPVWDQYYTAAITLADLDNDGDVEIIASNLVVDHEGNLLWTMPEPTGRWGTMAAVDLDDDEDLEVVLGHSAFHHDGTVLFDSSEELFGVGLPTCDAVAISCGSYPQIVNVDADDHPEILLSTAWGVALLEHDGTVVYSALKPTGDPGYPEAVNNNWYRASAVHDMNGDGQPNFAMSSGNNYATYELDAAIVWSMPVKDYTGIAAGTAFDFLGDGTAEAMYGDEHHLWVFDGSTGQVLMQVPRRSLTLGEFPVVADIDNDAHAEILVVSNSYPANDPDGYTIRAIRDAEDRWMPARRIWNQHAYHVTNVREDGTIPQFQPKSWLGLNTFRTNAQIEVGGAVCDPAG